MESHSLISSFVSLQSQPFLLRMLFVSSSCTYSQQAFINIRTVSTRAKSEGVHIPSSDHATPEGDLALPKCLLELIGIETDHRLCVIE